MHTNAPLISQLRPFKVTLEGRIRPQLAALFTILIFATSLASGGTNPIPKEQQEQITPAAQAQMSAAIGHDQSQYHFVALTNGYRAENSRQGLLAEFTPSGVELRSGVNDWGMALRGYGYGDQLRSANSVSLHADANRLEYPRGALTEWYVNGPLGLEQGFTFTSALGKSENEPLTLALTLSGNLTASVEADARSVELKRNGSEILRYAGLVARDTTGRELSAWFEVSGNELRMRVDDKGALYPLTIDPIVQAHKLIDAQSGCSVDSPCPDGQPNDHFGSSVAVSSDGNTIVGLVPGSVEGPTETSILYVFQKPTTGWQTCPFGQIGCFDFIAKLTTSGKILGLTQVAMSGDASTIVGLVGRTAYVFVKPSTGWVNATETAQLTVPETGPSSSFWPSSTSINGDGSVIAIGYTGGLFDDQPTEPRGAIFVFVKPNGGWVTTSTETAKLSASDGATNDFLGYSVTVSSDGNTIAAGAPEATVNSVAHSGAVYVFAKQPVLSWGNSTQIAKLTPSAPVQHVQLGFGYDLRVDGSGGTIISTDTDDVYIFIRPACGGICILGPQWSNATETARLTTSDAQSILTLGISGDGRTISAGATGGNPSSILGAVYLYAEPAGGWTTSTETQKVSASDGIAGDEFGSSTALSDDGTVTVVGAPGATDGSNLDEGALYVFTGFAGTPTASVSPSSLTFGNQLEGTTSSSQIVTIANSGNAPLNITSVVASPQYQTSDQCVGVPIAPGFECSENVAFAPTSLGTINGTLTFTDNSGGASTQQVQLTGAGIVTPTSTTVSSSLNPSIYGQAVTFKAIVTNASRTPTGSVTFTIDGTSSYGPFTLSGGTLAYSTAALLGGAHSIVASYSGDAGNSFDPSSSAPLIQMVNLATSATTVTSSVNPSYIGQDVVFTATVTSQYGGNVIPGNIIFMQGGTQLCAPFIMDGPVATCSHVFLGTAGTYSITAVYSGNGNNLGSTSAALRQTVKTTPIVTTTVVTTSGSPSLIGQSVTFTATISSTDGVPDPANVTFYDGATPVGTVMSSSSGVAMFSTTTLTAKTHTIKATYAGDATYRTSTGSVSQVVALYPSTTSLIVTPSLIAFGQTALLTASITSGAPGGPTGTVKFLNGNTSLGSAPLNMGVAILSTTKLTSGVITITATYSGDSQSATSSKNTSYIVAQATSTTTVLSSKNPATAGTSVKFTATSSSPTTTPTGSVIFMDGTTTLATVTLSGGKASYTTTALTSGTHNISVVYAGTANIVGSTSPALVQTIN